MNKKILSFILAGALLGTPIISMAASHIHNFVNKVYVSTSQEGSYTHSYISGYNPNTGQAIYGTCTVIRETEHYTWKCNQCSATNGSFTVTTEDHSSCGQ